MLLGLCHKRGNVINDEKVIKWCFPCKCKHLEIQIERRGDENFIGKKARKGGHHRLPRLRFVQKIRFVGQIE